MSRKNIHINPNTGYVGPCDADPTNPNSTGCQFGEHYETQQEARVEYEKMQIDQLLTSFSKGEMQIPTPDPTPEKDADSIPLDTLLTEKPLDPLVTDDELAAFSASSQNVLNLLEETHSGLRGLRTSGLVPAPEKAPETVEKTEEEASTETFDYPDPNETLDQVMQDLDSFVGMSEIKAHIKNTSHLLHIQAARREAGLPTVEVGIHQSFIGGPGTGKTSIARMMGRAYKAAGRLSKGHVVEVDREDLVAGFVGQSAEKTKKVLESAKGGVLFIDEAYSLTPSGGSGNDYGQESIATILKFMEDNRDDFCLIVAGYPKEMQTFMDSNSGLSGRFSDNVKFPDYSAAELDEIMERNVESSGYIASPEVKKKIRDSIQWMVDHKGENFGNGRTVRTFFENVVQNQATRLATQATELNKEALQELRVEDLNVNLAKIANPRTL